MQSIDTSSIELFEEQNTYLAFNTHFFSIYKIDSLTFKILTSLKSDPNLSIQEIAKLTGKEEKEVEQALSELISSNIFNKREIVADGPSEMLNLVLNVSETCNFACKYCYAKRYCRQYDTSQLGTSKEVFISYETGKKAICYFIKSITEIKARRLALTFFGGEPLLNLQTIKRLVRYAETQSRKTNLKIDMHIVTNGSLLTPSTLKYLDKHKFGLTISIDGRKEDHDRHRVFDDGTSTYDAIIPNIKNALDTYKGHIHSSTTIARGNNVYEAEMHILNLGFKHTNAEFVSTNMVDTQVTQQDVNNFLVGEKALARYLLLKKSEPGKGIDYMPLERILTSLVGDQVNLRHTCWAGRGYFAVSVNGDIYPCSAFVGLKEFRMGNVHDSTPLKDNPIYKTFAGLTVDKKKKCSHCWAKFICGGGCYFESYLQYKDLFIGPSQKHCQRMQNLVKTAIVEIARMSDRAQAREVKSAAIQTS